MKILITGGAGFIGSHIADACLQAQHQVLIVDDLSSGRKENVAQSVHFIKGDIRDRELVNNTFAQFQPDILVHQAAQASVAISTREPQMDADINIIGGLNLLQACVTRQVKQCIFASTGGAIYGEVKDGERAGIDWSPKPLSPYACAKFAFENYLHTYRHEYGLQSTILRYANVYGPRQDPHGEAGVVAIFARRLLDQQALQINARKNKGDEGCVRDYVFVDDVVRANMLAIDGQVSTPVSNIGTGQGTSTLQLAQTMAQVAGLEPELRYGPRREGDVERSVLNPETVDIWGPITSLSNGLGKTLAWFSAN